MPFTYVIADLHGRFDLLVEAIARIGEYAEEPGHERGTIITLGDYVDRGPNSCQIIELLSNKANLAALCPGWDIITLKGNHEDIMQICCRQPGRIGWWMQNGGGMTLLSYGQTEGEMANPAVVPAEHLRWIDSLPLMHVDAHRVYVHAGVDPDEPLEAQEELLTREFMQLITWKLYAKDDQRGHGDLHVVHGHHQFEDGPKLYQGRTDLDTLAWATGRLVVGVFDDSKPGGPVDFIEVQGTPDPRWNLKHTSAV